MSPFRPHVTPDAFPYISRDISILLSSYISPTYSSLFLHPHSEVAKLAPGELAQVINWAYRGKRPDADPRAWTGEREMIGGVRTSALGKLSNSDSDHLQL